MQAAEIGHARGRAHAAEKAVALDQQRAPARARGGDGCGNSCWAAAEDNNLIFAIERNLARGFYDGLERQDLDWQGGVPHVSPHHAKVQPV
jgi:hypothetical protein